jgi:hypothetical protein
VVVSTLTVVPITLREANAFVKKHHRHAGKARGHRWSLGAVANGKIIGVVLVGNPKPRPLNDGWTADANRVCTSSDAPKNTGSFLYGRAWRVWQAMGGRRMITYTLPSESGASLRGVGWKLLGVRKGRKSTANPWGSSERKRQHRPIYEADKLLWEVRVPGCVID